MAFTLFERQVCPACGQDHGWPTWRLLQSSKWYPLACRACGADIYQRNAYLVWVIDFFIPISLLMFIHWSVAMAAFVVEWTLLFAWLSRAEPLVAYPKDDAVAQPTEG